MVLAVFRVQLGIRVQGVPRTPFQSKLRVRLGSTLHMGQMCAPSVLQWGIRQ
jgi:hypothetical protein